MSATAGAVTGQLAPLDALDPCIVETAPLSFMVQAFIDRWLTTRRSRKGQGDFGKNGPDPTYVEPIGAYQRLEADTAASGLRIDANVLRKLRKPAEYPYSELRVADAIITVLGTPEMFHPDLCATALVVMPNPLVRDQSRWAECCGGSSSPPAVTVTVGMVIRFTDGELTAPPSSCWL